MTGKVGHTGLTVYILQPEGNVLRGHDVNVGRPIPCLKRISGVGTEWEGTGRLGRIIGVGQRAGLALLS